MSRIQEELNEIGAKAAFEADGSDWAMATAGMRNGYLRDAAANIAAVEPLIRADERERVSSELEQVKKKLAELQDSYMADLYRARERVLEEVAFALYTHFPTYLDAIRVQLAQAYPPVAAKPVCEHCGVADGDTHFGYCPTQPKEQTPVAAEPSISKICATIDALVKRVAEIDKALIPPVIRESAASPTTSSSASPHSLKDRLVADWNARVQGEKGQ